LDDSTPAAAADASAAPALTDKSRRTGGRMVRELIETALLALVIYAGVRLFILPYEVEGASMNPNLQNDERLLVSRQAYFHVDVDDVFGFLPFVDGNGHHVIYPFGKPARGDVIVFNPPTESDKPYVKRIIGLPGDRITFSGGYVFLNGERLDESYVDGSITLCSESPNCDLGVIPEGYVFVLGDNRLHSSDSRFFGLVDVDDIIGQAVFANWPLDAIGPVDGGNYDE
jgi:signal peptidase I